MPDILTLDELIEERHKLERRRASLAISLQQVTGALAHLNSLIARLQSAGEPTERPEPVVQPEMRETRLVNGAPKQ